MGWEPLCKKLFEHFYFYKFSCAGMQAYEHPQLRPLHMLTDDDGKSSSEWRLF